MPRSKNNKDDKLHSPAWMVTYGDMMTLLLVFFVLLYSFSVMDLDKFQGFISALQSRLGVLDGGTTISEDSLVSKGSMGEKFNPATQQVYAKVMGEMNQFINEQGLKDMVSMEITKRGLVIRFTGQILYELGKADIKPGGEKILDKSASIIKDINNEIMVEGHTDNLPIDNDEFPSNWELSTARATNVIRYLIAEKGLNPSRISAAGFSEYRPLYPNDTIEHRAKNRRIEIVILNSIYNEER
jgi:chemotaxis protein MotB